MRHGSAIALFLAVLIAAATVHAEQPIEEAKDHFEKGVKLFKNEDYDAALVEFKQAYKAKPHFAVRYNIGITLYKLHRYKEALEELESYMFQGGDELLDERRDEVVEILKELESLLGTLKVVCDVEGATLSVDGWESGDWEMRLEVGEHVIEVTAPGHPPYKQKIELPAGQEVLVEIDLAAPPAETTEQEPERERTHLKPAAFWSMAGVTAALGISAAITGGLALKQKADYAGLGYGDDWEPEREKGLKLALTTDVLLGVAGAAAVTTIVLAIFTDFGGEDRDDLSFLISPTPESLTLGIGGTF
jgi:hypothetical protein